jgi:hypothetical protein
VDNSVLFFFFIDKRYFEILCCDVVCISICHLLLDIPLQYDSNVEQVKGVQQHQHCFKWLITTTT